MSEENKNETANEQPAPAEKGQWELSDEAWARVAAGHREMVGMPQTEPLIGGDEEE